MRRKGSSIEASVDCSSRSGSNKREYSSSSKNHTNNITHEALAPLTGPSISRNDNNSEATATITSTAATTTPTSKSIIGIQELHIVTDKLGTPINISHYIAIFLWLGWIGSYFILLASSVVMYLYYRKAFYTFIAIVAFAAFVPIKRDTWYTQPGWSKKLGLWIMLKAEEYFGLRIFSEEKDAIERNGQAIFFLEPHDVLPITIFAFQDMLGYFPGHKMLGGLSGSMFKAPFMRHTLTWANATSVDKKNLQRYLSTGHSIVVCPGGASEAMYLKQSNKEYTLFLNNRFGLIKLAMEYGVPIYPTFTFGLRKTYPVWAPNNSFIRSWGSKMGYVPLFFLGIFNIPFAQPKPTPLTLVVGKPIFVDKLKDPSILNMKSEDFSRLHPCEDKLMRDIHRQVVGDIERIFETYKAQFDMGDTKLNIL